MRRDENVLGEDFVKLALAIDEHQPGYVDSYFGPEDWRQEAKRAGKVPLPSLAKSTDRLANEISQSGDMDAQRKDFLARQVTAMQMSLRLLSGEKVSLVKETSALYDVQPQWKEEANFEEAQRELDQILPPGESFMERQEDLKKSLELPMEKVRELLPFVTDILRERTCRKFNLPAEETFAVEFVSDQP